MKRVAAGMTLLLILSACSSPGAPSPSATAVEESPEATSGAEASSIDGQTSEADAPPGSENTQVTDWADPRPAEWTSRYPRFAPITTIGDGSLKRVQDAGEIVVCSALGLVPWNFIDPATSEVLGVEVAFLEYISEVLGLGPAEYLNVEFQALIPALQAGQCDVIMSSLGIRADRGEQVRFTVPYMLTFDQFVVANDSSVESSDDLKDGRLGTFAGTSDEDVLRAWVEGEGEGAEVLTFNTINECLLATRNGTTDACFTDNVAISAAIEGEFSDLRKLPETFDYAAGFPDDAAQSPYRLLSIATATQLEDLDLNLAFSIAIQQMIDEGYAQEVLEKWNLWDENQGEMTRPDA